MATIFEDNTIVVGNGGSLLEEKAGDRIDSYDCVIRFNNYQLLPEYTGEKTTVWACSFSPKIKMRSEKYPKVICPFPVHYQKTLERKYPVNKRLLKKYRPYCVPLSIHEDLTDIIPVPSTGIALLWWMYHTHKLPTVVGFPFFNLQVKHHYFQDHLAVANPHDGRREWELFQAMTANAIPRKTTTERLKYQRVWSVDDYRRWSPGWKLVPVAISKMRIQKGDSLIDFGCGTGRSVARFRQLGINAMGIDIAKNCLNESIRIPFRVANLWEEFDWHADYGFCIDVMEHIPVEFVSVALENIHTAVSRSVLFKICLREDECGSLVDETLHLTVRSERWWRSQLAKHWKLQKLRGKPDCLTVICRRKS